MKLAGFDVETKGTEKLYALQPFRARTGEAWLTSYAFATEQPDGKWAAHATRNPGVEELRSILRHAARTKTYLVGWNTPFDVAWLIALGLRDEVYACRWLDGMLLLRHWRNRPKFMFAGGEAPSESLKAIVREFVPHLAGYEEGIDFDAEDDESVAKRLLYNKLDAVASVILANKFLRDLDPATKRNALIEAQAIPMAADTMVYGIAMDGEAARELKGKLTDEGNLAYVTLKIREGDITPEMLASPKQLGDLLFKRWGLPKIKITDAGADSTDKEVLTRLSLHDDRAKLVHEYRDAKNNRTKFAEGTLDSLAYNGDGHVRPAFRIFGTYTGRGTYSSKVGKKGKEERPSGVALHQWKKGKDFRRLIRAPEGHTLLEWDFSGQEFRWMAVESGDHTMLQLCEPGEDAHAYMGGRVSQISYEEMKRGVAAEDEHIGRVRQMGKVGNLSLQYRTSAPRLQGVAEIQYRLPLTLGEARALHATYRTTYPGVPLYWKRQVYLARTTGVIRTVAGRCVHLGMGDTWNPELAWSYESTSINFPIQGAGADQKYLALMMLRDYLPKVDGRFYFELHDGLFAVVPDRYAEKAAVEVTRLLSNLPYKQAWGVDLPVQFPVDPKMGPNWGELKKVHI